MTSPDANTIARQTLTRLQAAADAAELAALDALADAPAELRDAVGEYFDCLRASAERVQEALSGDNREAGEGETAFDARDDLARRRAVAVQLRDALATIRAPEQTGDAELRDALETILAALAGWPPDDLAAALMGLQEYRGC